MYSDILLAIDLNHDSSWQKTLPTAIEYCKAFNARLHIMTVVPSFNLSLVGGFFPEGFEEKAREAVNQRLHEFVRDHVPQGVTVQHIVAEGTIYEEILKTANLVNADLIVMAKRRPDMKDYLLGHNAERVARHAEQSILIVHE